MVDRTTAPLSPRVRPAIRRLAYWLGPVLFLIASWQIWDAVEALRLERAIQRTFAEGMPANPAVAFNAGRQRPPGQSDAAAYYAAANMAAVTIGFGSSDERSSAFDVTMAYREAMFDDRDVSAETAAAASAYLARYELPLRLVEQARNLPFGGATPGAESAYRLSGIWTISRLAGLRTLDLIHRAEAGSAFDSLIARMRFVRAFTERPWILDQTLAAQQIRMTATDTGILLSRARLSDMQLATLQDTLAGLVDDGGLEHVMASEVSWMYGNLESIWSGRRIGTGAFTWLARPLLRHHATALVQIAGDALAAARLPWPERPAAMAEIDRRRSMLPEFPQFVAGWRILPQLEDLTATMAAGVAAARASALVVAIERHRRQHGAVPAQLTELVPPPDREAVQDPFTGGSLKYARIGQAYAVYSVGSDGRDDGGKLLPDLPPGRMPGTLPPPDIGVRVTHR